MKYLVPDWVVKLNTPLNQYCYRENVLTKRKVNVPVPFGSPTDQRDEWWVGFYQNIAMHKLVETEQYRVETVWFTELDYEKICELLEDDDVYWVDIEKSARNLLDYPDICQIVVEEISDEYE
jgi:hypothetical protein